MSLREQSIVGCFPEFALLFNFSVAQVLERLRKQFKQIIFPSWACAAGFNNNDNNNNNNSSQYKNDTQPATLKLYNYILISN